MQKGYYYFFFFNFEDKAGKMGGEVCMDSIVKRGKEGKQSRRILEPQVSDSGRP